MEWAIARPSVKSADGGDDPADYAGKFELALSDFEKRSLQAGSKHEHEHDQYGIAFESLRAGLVWQVLRQLGTTNWTTTDKYARCN